MARRNANGEGSIYRRKDGRYEGSAYFLTTSGTRKRVRVYGKTRAEVHDKLIADKMLARQGIPIPDKTRRLGEYLDYWLREVILANRRPTTYERYEMAVRLHLKPGLGMHILTRLSVSQVQSFLNQKLTDGFSIRNVQIMREVLRAALSRAIREELIIRNVASLVELPKWEPPEIQPWTADEAKRFLEAARIDPLYPAFLLLVMYGLRRGEVVGLRWSDVDFERSMIHVRQQVQRIDGRLQACPVKTRAGRRDLPLLMTIRNVLTAYKSNDKTEDFVFQTKTGQPVEPHNFSRSFQRICQQHGMRRIRMHDVRHTIATLLKNTGVPARDAQLILGHSTVIITQEIYQHSDMDSRIGALERVERLFLRTAARVRCRQILPSTPDLVAELTSFLSGRGSRTRTYDTWFWRSLLAGASGRATEVNRVINERRRQWLLGCVAVSVAVKPNTKSVTHESSASRS